MGNNYGAGLYAKLQVISEKLDDLIGAKRDGGDQVPRGARPWSAQDELTALKDWFHERFKVAFGDVAELKAQVVGNEEAVARSLRHINDRIDMLAESGISRNVLDRLEAQIQMLTDRVEKTEAANVQLRERLNDGYQLVNDEKHERKKDIEALKVEFRSKK